MAIAEHLVATTRRRIRTLTVYEQAIWLWVHVLSAVPQALSLVLMPDHLHLVALPGAGAKLRKTLNGFTCAFGVALDLNAPEAATTRAIAARQIRYGFLNPVRAGLVSDPWSWPWSTLHDLAGAVDPVRTDPDAVARVLGHRRSTMLRGFSVAGGQPVPVPRTSGGWLRSTDDLVSAAAAALRMPVSDVPGSRSARRLVVQLSRFVDQPPRLEAIGAALRIRTTSARRLRCAAPHPGLDAALLCLSDNRLTPPTALGQGAHFGYANGPKNRSLGAKGGGSGASTNPKPGP